MCREGLFKIAHIPGNSNARSANLVDRFPCIRSEGLRPWILVAVAIFRAILANSAVKCWISD